MTHPPAVSVLMPCYNAGPFLDSAIASIVRQSFRDWELLIVDDASTDGSLETAEAWARKDCRIRVIRNAANKGQTMSLNQGLGEARGKWIARQDADDLSHPLRLGRQFEVLSARPELALLGTSGRMIDARNRLVGLLDVPSGGAAIRATTAFLNPFLHTAVIFSRAVVVGEFGGYDESFRIAQDYDLWQRVVGIHPTANLSARLVCYRHLETSLSKAGAGLAFEEARRVAMRVPLPQGVSKEAAAAMEGLREGRAGVDLVELGCGLGAIGKTLPESEQSGWRRYSARLLLRACGAGGFQGRLASLLAAAQTDMVGTLGWLRERYL